MPRPQLLLHPALWTRCSGALLLLRQQLPQLLLLPLPHHMLLLPRNCHPEVPC
jgi:hypothetical protein